MQTLGTAIFIEMQSDLAVRSGAETVPRFFQFALDRFVVVEFAVDDDAGASVLARDRLIAGGQVDDAEPGVPESNPPVG